LSVPQLEDGSFADLMAEILSPQLSHRPTFAAIEGRLREIKEFAQAYGTLKL
jgi:hypothetical protein